MYHPCDDDTISWVEDLDPEPPPHGRLWQWRELILGLMVALAVLGWAGWQWVSQLHDESEYKQGEQALQANDLEEAASHFGSIPDYKDAGSRARELGTQIGERDSWYQELTTGYESGNWLQAYDAAQHLRKVVPGESYVETLFSTAREHVYTEALSGTVLSRLDADPPGLYYRAGDKWIWLVDSDASSRILGTGPPGHMLYDITITDQGRTPGKHPGYGLEGNSLMLATFTPDGLTFKPLTLDPAAFDYFIWGDEGVWGLADKVSPYNRQIDGPGTFYAGYEIAYEAYNSPVIQDMKPKGNGWVVIDFAPDGQQVLLADVSKLNSSHPWIGLYAADGDGTNLRLLYSFNGRFQRAIFSPDSRYVLLTTFSRFAYDMSAGKQTIQLLDTTAQHPPRVLAEVDKSYDSTTYYLDHSLSSTFLQSGPYAGRILLIDSAANQTTSVSVVDPDNVPRIIPKWSFQGDFRRNRYTWGGEVETDQGLMIVLQSATGVDRPYLQVFWHAGVTANEFNGSFAFESTRIELGGNERVQDAWLMGDRLIYAVTNSSPTSNLGPQFTINSFLLPFFDANGTLSDHATKQLMSGIFGTTLDYQFASKSIESPPLGVSIVVGPSLLASGLTFESGNKDGKLAITNPDGTTKVFYPSKGYEGYELFDWSPYKVLRGSR